MHRIKSRIFRVCYMAILITAVAVSSGCANKKTINFKIDSVPKGAYVLYQVVGEGIACQGQWIYLGNTPLNSVRRLSERELDKADKITLRIMYNGYQDQTKEWDGEGFWEEISSRDVLYWAPQMVAPEKEQ